MRKILIQMVQIVLEIVLIPYIFIHALMARFKAKSVTVGLGPEPLINNVYHKMALEKYGYSAQTFILSSYFITNAFDIDLSRNHTIHTFLGRLRIFFALTHLAFNYKILYFYFNGGPLGLVTKFIWRLEPFFYKLAGVKTVVMPYGGDIQDLTRTSNLYFKHVMSLDYPKHRIKRQMIASKIDLWTRYADHIIGGCDWVEYLYYWDTLTLAHFSFDTTNYQTCQKKNNGTEPRALKVFHAPNHMALKGTHHLQAAIDQLKADGYDIDLVMLTNVSNEKILQTISTVDIVADQFVIGWYAMFAIEAMALGKPVMCYLRKDFLDLYTNAGLIENDEIPIINTSISDIAEKLKWVYENRDQLEQIGQKSQQYVVKHHSIETIGNVFDRINKTLLGKSIQ